MRNGPVETPSMGVKAHSKLVGMKPATFVLVGDLLTGLKEVPTLKTPGKLSAYYRSRKQKKGPHEV